MDSLGREFPWNSSYAFAENEVIRAIELEGLEKIYPNPKSYKLLTTYLKVISQDEVLKDKLFLKITQRNLEDKIHIYFGWTNDIITNSNGSFLDHDAMKDVLVYGASPAIAKGLGITLKEFKEKEKQGIKVFGIIIYDYYPGHEDLQKLLTIAHESYLHLRKEIESYPNKNKSTGEDDHIEGYGEKYYKKNNVDPFYSPEYNHPDIENTDFKDIINRIINSFEKLNENDNENK